MFDLVWNLIDVANGVYLIETFPTLLECVEAAGWYFEAVRRGLACYAAVAA